MQVMRLRFSPVGLHFSPRVFILVQWVSLWYSKGLHFSPVGFRSWVFVIGYRVFTFFVNGLGLGLGLDG